MKKILLSLLIANATFANAQSLPPLPPQIALPPQISAPNKLDVSFPAGISIVEFARFLLQDVMRAPFLFSPDFLASNDQVAFQKNAFTRESAAELLNVVLNERGYTLTKKSGFHYITKTVSAVASAEKTDYLVYKPKARSTGYLSSLLVPLFPIGSFSFQARGSSQTSAPVLSSSTQHKVVDTGTTANSPNSQSDLDAFTFTGTLSNIAKLQSMLETLDTPPAGVYVRALFVETSRTNNDASSLNLVMNALNSRLSLSLSSTTLGNSLSFNAGSVESVISALSVDSRFTVRTAPAIYVSTGETGSLKIGSRVPTLGGTVSTNGQVVQNYVYQDVGTNLSVAPRVLSDSISVTYSLEISDAVKTTTGVDSTPTLNQRLISSSFTTKSKEFVVLGGLTNDKRSNANNKMPFFNFSLGKNSSDSTSDLLVILYTELR